MKLFAAFTVLASLLTFSEAGCSCNANRGTAVSNCYTNQTYNASCDCWTGCNYGGCNDNRPDYFIWSSQLNDTYYCSWTMTYNEKCRNYYWRYSNVCNKCNSGHYRHSANSCRACTTCNSGKYQQTDCSRTSNQNRVCNDCASINNCGVGVTCTNGSNSKCSTCKSNFYKVFGTKDQCRACRTCFAGKYQTRDCSQTKYENRLCSDCASISNCGVGVTCTNGSNSKCSTCKSEYFKVAGTKDECRSCRTCNGATEYQLTDCTATSNRTCTSCNPVANCKNSTTCSTAHNSQCDECQKGYFLVEGDKDECKPCKRCAPGFGPVEGTCQGTTDRSCETKQKTRIKFDKFYKRKNGRPSLKKPTDDVYQFRAIGENGVTVAFFNEATMPTDIPENYRGATEVTFGKVSGIADCLGCANSVEYADKALVTDAEWSDLWIHVVGDKVQAGAGVYEEGDTTPLFEFDSSTSSDKKTSEKNLDIAVFTYGYYENHEDAWSSCPQSNPFPYIAGSGVYYCCATAGDAFGQLDIHRTNPFTSDSCENNQYQICDEADTTKKCYRYTSAV